MKIKSPVRFLVLVTLVSLRLSATDDHPVIPLWPTGAPGSEARKDEPEKVNSKGFVSNIHNPSLTVYLPAKENATHCAVIVVPGAACSPCAGQVW